MRPIHVHGSALAGGRLPAICAPLVARDRDALVAEAAAVAARGPDLLEWRVDFFSGIGDARLVIDTAAAIRSAAPGMPLLFTRRSMREGGEAASIGEEQVVALYREVCRAGAADLVDFEAASEPRHLSEVRDAARANGVGLVLSWHDFHRTPEPDRLLEGFERAERLGADVAKIAVMPRREEDVLALLQATLRASRALRIPVVGMAMGGLGAVTRLAGGVFGSALTFAVGANASAPGQVPIDEVRAVLEVLRRGAVESRW
ncbi:MAG TPA: type I 3-dehydroquinate dehydratase [Ramlibacter sp.]|uniref:type I 3-dehydroquinate dehydratase n=1 Tax=Ramlibacter sp. TaxID=1917967 RepID=UPI002CB74C26|nr:type I 3-dehydroquinate dehydratase [Ramlibacter sp.]HVZ42897.1 type I 3-dehydroquinate dehydratase [Ramlibacter sp.]